jgi:alpha-NAC-related protein
MGNLQGISPKAMQKALGQIDTNEIDNVTEVIVRTTEEEIVLKNPEVTIMNMGQEIWNIVPQSVSKRPLGSSEPASEPIQVDVKDSDVDLIVSTAGVSREEAIKAIQASSGDIAKAIMSLK